MRTDDGFSLESLAETARAADFGDKRLSARFSAIMRAVGEAPSSSFPVSLSSEKDLEGFYRFINNDKVDFGKASEPFFKQTAARCEEARSVYVAHDTSDFAFSGDRDGLGRLHTGKNGFRGHFSLAIAKQDGVAAPLGILGVRHIVRPAAKQKRYTGNQARLNKNYEWKRWGESVDDVEARLEGKASAIHLMDSEADAYWLFAHLQGKRAIIRLCHDRQLIPDDEHGPTKVREALNGIEVQVMRNVDVSPRDGKSKKKRHAARAQRSAKLSIRAMQVRLKKPPYADHETHASPGLPNFLTVNIVQVIEIDPPEGQPPVEWLLITQEPIDTTEQILDIVDAYRLRWLIEEFFKVLKTGCAYEARQSETFEALLNVLAVCLPIACRLLALRTIERQKPQVPASEVFTQTELLVLRVLYQKKLAEEPTVEQAIAAIASVGGHLRQNGKPGWLVLWRGYVKIQDSARTLLLVDKARQEMAQKM